MYSFHTPKTTRTFLKVKLLKIVMLGCANGRSVGVRSKPYHWICFVWFFLLSGHQICVYVYKEAKNKSQQNNNRKSGRWNKWKLFKRFPQDVISIAIQLESVESFNTHQWVKQHTTYARIPIKNTQYESNGQQQHTFNEMSFVHNQ